MQDDEPADDGYEDEGDYFDDDEDPGADFAGSDAGSVTCMSIGSKHS